MTSVTRKVLVTGGAGYVGSALCPALVARGHFVRVLDTCWYGDDVFPSLTSHPQFEIVKGDIRDEAVVARAVSGCTDVIHLACISNDPSYDMDPALGESINFTAFEPLVAASKYAGVRRFLYASSSSVYGVKLEERVTEELELEPLTDYSRFKALCEPILFSYVDDDFTGVAVRPATVCGFAPRQRLDVVVNILVNHAVNRGVIRVFGGEQFRPNLHIDDMVDAYSALLEAPSEVVNGKAFNVGGVNHTVLELATIVQENVPGKTVLDVQSSDDDRSYRISSELIRQTIGFSPKRVVAEAVKDLVNAFQSGQLPNSLEDSRYFNIKRMNELSQADRRT